MFLSNKKYTYNIHNEINPIKVNLYKVNESNRL